jgi:hypothetical protein
MSPVKTTASAMYKLENGKFCTVIKDTIWGATGGPWRCAVTYVTSFRVLRYLFWVITYESHVTSL